jgi:hypothetical protein
MSSSMSASAVQRAGSGMQVACERAKALTYFSSREARAGMNSVRGSRLSSHLAPGTSWMTDLRIFGLKVHGQEPGSHEMAIRFPPDKVQISDWVRGPKPPPHRTGRADLPHPALQSVVSSSGIACRLPGRGHGEQPLGVEVSIGPAPLPSPLFPGRLSCALSRLQVQQSSTGSPGVARSLRLF